MVPMQRLIPPGEPTPDVAFAEVSQRVTIQHFHHAGPPYGDDLAALVSLVEQDRLHPEIGRTEDWPRTAATLV
ncbi:hypothetical protein VM98_37565, partial [Streptomyces rubellomurinus subsp. indigoferus]